MFESYAFTVEERFLRYVRIDTQSDPSSSTQPSTMKQLNLSRFLLKELEELGIAAELDNNGYVYATIPSNSEKNIPVICFCAHVDTSPDSSGENVKPIVHRNYDGSPLVLPDDPTQVITTDNHPYLKKKIGDDIITASGTTLLGADDKAGIAVIMDMANFLVGHPEIKHGEIKLLFTPDEEIGRGVNALDMKKLAASYGYTLDGGPLGSYEDETFSADGMIIRFNGVSAHPGYAKDKMINALKLCADFLVRLPSRSFSPETTEGREGFVHPVRISGSAESAEVEFIIRDFNTSRLTEYEKFLQEKVNETLALHKPATASVKVVEQYRNMKEVLDKHPQVTSFAHEAIQRAGLELISMSARGGTDGSRLSFMGLPCANLFTGEMAFHGKQEYVSVQDMKKSVETIVHLAMIWEEKGAH